MKKKLLSILLLLALTACGGDGNSDNNSNETKEAEKTKNAEVEIETPENAIVTGEALEKKPEEKESSKPRVIDVAALEKENEELEKVEVPSDGISNQTIGDGTISFEINVEGDGAKKTLKVKPKGFESVNKEEIMEINGPLKKVELADLDKDSFQELVLFIKESDTKENIVVFSSINNKVMSKVVPLTVADSEKTGYRGEDKYKINDNQLVRVFPKYKEGDKKGKPSGGKRTLAYELVVEEATKFLKVKGIKNEEKESSEEVLKKEKPEEVEEVKEEETKETEAKEEKKEEVSSEKSENLSADIKEQTLKAGEVSYHLKLSGDDLTITPSGFKKSNKVEKLKVDGTIYDLDAADLDGDSYPELLIFVTRKGKSGYGEAIVYTSYNNNSMGRAFFAQMSPKEVKGYIGQDKFKLENGKITRRFPVYNEGDKSGKPTGGTRTLTYDMIKGKNSKIFTVSNKSDEAGTMEMINTNSSNKESETAKPNKPNKLNKGEGEFEEINIKEDKDKNKKQKLVEAGAVNFTVSQVGNKLTIVPEGFTNSNDIITEELDGEVYGIETADLDHDSYPELVIFLVRNGRSSYGEALIYSSNNNRSMSQAYIAQLTRKQKEGYLGEDKFKLVNGELKRTFPVYNQGDKRGNPTGGKRTLTYDLVDGEAGKILKVVENTGN